MQTGGLDSANFAHACVSLPPACSPSAAFVRACVLLRAVASIMQTICKISAARSRKQPPTVGPICVKSHKQLPEVMPKSTPTEWGQAAEHLAGDKPRADGAALDCDTAAVVTASSARCGLLLLAEWRGHDGNPAKPAELHLSRFGPWTCVGTTKPPISDGNRDPQTEREV